MRQATMTDFGTDAKLVELAQGGSRQAFAILARRWGARLHAFLRRVLGNDEEARDVCQDALLKAYLNLAQLRQPQHFKKWLHTIALNLCRDQGRLSRPVTVPLDEVDREPVSTAATPLERAEDHDLAGRLGKALAQLPVEQRIAVLLCEIQGFTSPEIAAMTGAPAATVRSRIFYGLKTLRGHLVAQGVDVGHLSGREDQHG